MCKQWGLSLVELMISILLGLVLMTGVVQVFLSSKNVFYSQQGLSRVQETGRLAMSFMSKDIGNTAYYGCFKVTGSNGNILGNSGLSVGGLHRDFGVGIVGYDSSGALPNGASTDLGTTMVPETTSSILVLRSAGPRGAVLNAATTTSAVKVYTAKSLDTNGCLEGICPGAAALISDCSQARVFAVSTLSLTAPTLTISHADSWTGYSSGQVLPMSTTVYFLARGTGGGPSLFQRVNNGTAMEVLEGVERMRITYSRKNAAGALQDGYVSATQVAAEGAWQRVVAVQVELVVRSLENNAVSEPQPYTFAGVVVNPAIVDPSDRHMRQVFSFVTTVRSRLTVN